MFFYTILGFTQTYSQVLGDIKGSVQWIPGSYKSDKPINDIGIEKVNSKCDCINRSILDGVRQPTFYGFALDKLPGHKIHKETRIKVSRKINKPILSHKTFYLQDDYHKAVDFNGETINFTCQLIKIQLIKKSKDDSTQKRSRRFFAFNN